MRNEIIENIRAHQDELPTEGLAPLHKPQMLLIGCVDARLNPKTDIGIPDGAAIIHRNIAALVREMDEQGSSVAASLEFAINVMRVQHIVVMGHTDCGGIRACLEDNHTHDTAHIRKYLLPLSEVRDDVLAHGGDIQAQARAMEMAAVKQSVANLMTYEVVQKSFDQGRVDIHGWVINTGTKRILELDLRTGDFWPMSPEKSAQALHCALPEKA